jgi:DNA-binding CsgD family transcriptional regulator
MLRFVATPREPDGLAVLTHRQREVLALMAEGMSNAAIARRLVVTEKAVVQHCSNIYAALDLPPTPDEHRRVLAVLRHVAQPPHAEREEPGQRWPEPRARSSARQDLGPVHREALAGTLGP